MSSGTHSSDPQTSDYFNRISVQVGPAETSEDRNRQFLGSEVVHFWDSEIVHFWDPEIIHFWDPEIVHFWDSQIVHFWDPEIVHFLDFQIICFWIRNVLKTSQWSNLSTGMGGRYDYAVSPSSPPSASRRSVLARGRRSYLNYTWSYLNYTCARSKRWSYLNYTENVTIIYCTNQFVENHRTLQTMVCKKS